MMPPDGIPDGRCDFTGAFVIFGFVSLVFLSSFCLSPWVGAVALGHWCMDGGCLWATLSTARN